MHRTAPPRHQRVAVLGTVFALHAALIFLFLWQSVEVTPVVEQTSIAMIAVDADRPAAAKPPPPTLPAKLADKFKPVNEFSVPAVSESDAPAGASGVCSTLAVVLDALLLDAAAIDAIRSAPPDARSVADAIVIWNEGWAPPALTPDAPLAVVRATIEKSLSTVTDSCLDEPVPGPRLGPIPDAGAGRTTFLVFGSGTWTWRALLTSPAIPTANGAVPAAIDPAKAQ